jgi:hypothetical protein
VNTDLPGGGAVRSRIVVGGGAGGVTEVLENALRVHGPEVPSAR